MDGEERAALEEELALQIKHVVIDDDDVSSNTDSDACVRLSTLDIKLVLQSMESESDKLTSDSNELSQFIAYAKKYGEAYCAEFYQELASMTDCEDHFDNVLSLSEEDMDSNDFQLPSLTTLNFPIHEAGILLKPSIFQCEAKMSGIEFHNSDVECSDSQLDDTVEECILESSTTEAGSSTIGQNPFFHYMEVLDTKYDVLEAIISDELIERECMYASQKQQDEIRTMCREDRLGHFYQNMEQESVERISMCGQDAESKVRELIWQGKQKSMRESNLMALEEKYERQRVLDELQAEAREQYRRQEMQNSIARRKIQLRSILSELQERHRERIYQQALCRLETDRCIREQIAMGREELFIIQYERFLKAERECMSWEDIASIRERVMMRKRYVFYQLRQNQLRCKMFEQLQECLRIRSEIHNMRHQDDLSLLQKHNIWDVWRARGYTLYTLYVGLMSKKLFRFAWNFWLSETRRSRKAFVAANIMQSAFRGYSVRRKYQSALRTASFVTTLEDDGDVYTAIDFESWIGNITTQVEEWVVPNPIVFRQHEVAEMDETRVDPIPQDFEEKSENEEKTINSTVQNAVKAEDGSFSLWNQWKSRHGKRKQRSQSKSPACVNHKVQLENAGHTFKWSTNKKLSEPKNKVISIVERLRNKTAKARCI